MLACSMLKWTHLLFSVRDQEKNMVTFWEQAAFYALIELGVSKNDNELQIHLQNIIDSLSDEIEPQGTSHFHNIG